MTGTGTEVHRLLARSVADVARRRIAPLRIALEHHPETELPPSLLEHLRELGLFEPLSDSGDEGDDGGFDVAGLGLALFELARVSAAPATIVLAHAVARRLVAAVQNGRPSALASGEHGLLGFPLYGEVEDTGVAWTSKGERLVLHGTSELVVNAPIAEGLVVPARDASDALALVLVGVRAEGVRVGRPLRTLGMRGAPAADVAFSGAVVEPGRVLARGPAAERLLARTRRRFYGAAASILAAIVGESTDTAVEHARQRYQGGRQIIDHPQVRAMLSEMQADRELCRDAARRLVERDLDAQEASRLFARVKEHAARATTDGVQLLGGYGYMEDYGQERCMRDAKQAQCLFGRCETLRQRAMAEWIAGNEAF